MYGLLSWIYVDVLVIVLCRSLTVLLRKFNESVQQSYVASEFLSGHYRKQAETLKVVQFWEGIRNKYMALMSLVEDMGKFLSPLFMICYGMNVYFIINNVSKTIYYYAWKIMLNCIIWWHVLNWVFWLQLYKWISPNRLSTLPDDLLYNYFAFTCFVLRVVSVTYFGAEVYHTGNSILRTLQQLPDSVYTFTVSIHMVWYSYNYSQKSKKYN